MSASRSHAPERRGAFGGFIGPRNLVELVRNTAPYLFVDDGPVGSAPDVAPPDAQSGRRLSDLGHHPLGWWAILRNAGALPANDAPDARARTEYFALCLAAHFATVTTFVPTDVDTKIRDALWFDSPEPEELRRMADLALATTTWDVSAVSRRLIPFEDLGPVSGHDGERLSIFCGGYLGLLRAGDAEYAAKLEAAIDVELRREADAFERIARGRGRERELCILAAHLTHNVGDVDQGLSAKGGQRVAQAGKARFGRLAHERAERYGASFARAAAIYRDVMAPEMHRHYPLRELRSLRAHPDLLLPIPPFLDGWGELLARWRGFDEDARASVLGGLIEGCRKIPGQEGYFRALAGFDRAYPGGLGSGALARGLSASARRELKEASLRRKIAIARESFESGCFKRARRALGS